MMSGSHAVSGASGGLGLCALAGPVAGLHPTPLQVAAVAVIAAGFAILPDLDHTGSRIARSLGPVTWIIARIFTFLADLIRDATCDHCATPGTHGHRTVSHTLLFAVAVGSGVSAAGHWGGVVGAAIVVGIGTGLGVLGLLESRIGAVVVGAAAGYAVYRLGGDVGWSWLGVPAGFGVLMHIAGDSITEQGCPLLAPFVRIKGCRWRRLALPRWLAFRTGGWVEGLVSVLMLGGGVAAGWMLVAGS